MFEDHRSPLAPRALFYRRLGAAAAFAAALVAASLAAGMWGYRHFERLTWLDAFLNAAMLLGGMGPVEIPVTRGGKLFAGLYALYAGLILLVSVGIMLTPVFHRLMHRFHLEEQDEADTGDRPRKHSKPGIG